MGYFFAEGLCGIKRDDEEAVRWYRKAAAHGDPSGERMLGYMLWTGRGTEPNREEAAKWYERAASHGDPPSSDP
jgi:TPR repeat protein